MMEKGIHLAEFIIASLVLAGGIVTAWVQVNLRINTNNGRIETMESRIDDICAETTIIKTDVKSKADRDTVIDTKADLLRELGGKIDYLTRMMEALAKKNGLDS